MDQNPSASIHDLIGNGAQGSHCSHVEILFYSVFFFSVIQLIISLPDVPYPESSWFTLLKGINLQSSARVEERELLHLMQTVIL